MTLWAKVKEVGIDLLLAFIFLSFFLFSSFQLASQKPVVFFIQEISGVYQGTEAEKAATRDLTIKTLDFIEGEAEEVDLLYTQREKFHLEETRKLFLKARRVWLILTSLVVLTLLFIRWTVLGWSERVRVITKGVAVFFFAVDLLVLFLFSSFFDRFHRFFFTPGTWQFGEKALLINLFPYRFWVVEAAFVLSLSAFLSTAVSFLLTALLLQGEKAG